MGETLDWINSCIENGLCDEDGEMFSGDPEWSGDFECIVAGCDFEGNDEKEMQEHYALHFKKEKQKQKMAQKLGGFINGQAVLDAKKKGIAGVIANVRPDDRYSGRYIMDFDTDIMPGKSSWRIPVAQMNRLIDMLGPNERSWVGHGVQLVVQTYDGFNPGFVVSKTVKPDLVAKSRKSKPKYESAAMPENQKVAALSDDECPF